MKLQCIAGEFQLSGLSPKHMAMIEVSLKHELGNREIEEDIKAIEEILEVLR